MNARPVMLINPPMVDTKEMGKLDYDLTWSPPIGLAQIAAVLEQHGIEVVARDYYYSSWPETEAELLDANPDIVGISVFSEQRASTYRLMAFVREALPDAKIVLGGPHPTFLWKQMIEHFGADSCVLGEGEESFLELVRVYRTGGDHAKVPGLAVRVGNEAVLTPSRPGIPDLDTLPLPNYKHFDTVSYQDVARDWLQHFDEDGRSVASLPYASTVASRGCPFNCHFCSTPATWGRGWRRFSVTRFVDELEWMVRDLGYRVIDFSDDIFTTNQKWTVQVCKEIVRRELPILWYACTRVDCVSPETLTWMKRAGCLFVSYGIESFSSNVLDALNKRTSKDRIRRAVEMTHEAGLATEYLLIVGSPGESDSTIHETLDFISETKPLIVSPSILTIFPGTELYSRAKANGFMDDDYWLTDKPTPYDTQEHPLSTLYNWYQAIASLDPSPLRHRVEAIATRTSP